MANTFDTEYGVTPWEDFKTNQRTVYVPDLLEVFRHKALFYKMVTYGVNLAAQRTGTMVFTQPIDPEPSIQAIDNRLLWLPQLYMDSRNVQITALRYGNKIQMHKYDDMITYWKENGSAGLRAIMSKRVAPNMVGSLDLLARNAFLDHAHPMFAGTASGFNDLAATDTFDPAIARALWLGADYQPDPTTNPIFGLVSPSATYSLKSSASSTEWVTRLQYARPVALINYEIGSYEDVRFAQSPLLTLWNCGTVIAQTTITAAANQGSGAPDPEVTPVDGVWNVGQPGVAATHYITVESTAGFTVGDYVTLHRVRPAANAAKATINGVTWNHYQNRTRRITEIVDATKMSFARPLLTEWYEAVVAEQSYYGWVTLARPIHCGIFIKGPRGVVSGVLQPPQTYTPPPVDDTESIFRFSWDAYLKYQIMYPSRFEVYFYAGPIRRLGHVINL